MISASKTAPRGWEVGVAAGRDGRDGTLGGRSTDGLGDTGGDDDDVLRLHLRLFLVRERRGFRRGDSRPVLLLAVVDGNAADFTDGDEDTGEAAALRLLVVLAIVVLLFVLLLPVVVSTSELPPPLRLLLRLVTVELDREIRGVVLLRLLLLGVSGVSVSSFSFSFFSFSFFSCSFSSSTPPVMSSSLAFSVFMSTISVVGVVVDGTESMVDASSSSSSSSVPSARRILLRGMVINICSARTSFLIR